MSCLEGLPDELFLIISSYLHKFDLLYAFTNLNQRFQQIILPYVYEFDLSNDKLSYEHFWFFYDKILPLFIQNIRSLKLGGIHQLELFPENIRNFNNLQSIHIKCAKNVIEHEILVVNERQFFVDALHLPFLSEMTVMFIKEETLNIISSCISPKLENLTLILEYIDFNFNGLSIMPSIKQLTINLKTMNETMKLLSFVPNIEKLSLSVIGFDMVAGLIEIPKQLQKLQLEFGAFRSWMIKSSLSVETVKSFVNLFKNQLHSLTLIGISIRDKDFVDFNKFQNIISDLNHLQNFEYCINTIHRPDSLFMNVEKLPESTYNVFTIPRPQPFDTFSERLKCRQSFSLTHVTYRSINCDTLDVDCMSGVPRTWKLNADSFANLQTIHFVDPIDDCSDEMRMCTAKIIAISSSKLQHIKMDCSGEGTIKICHRLKEMIPHGQENLSKIQYLQMSTSMGRSESNYDKRTFFIELSTIFPNLKAMRLWIEQDSIGNSYETFSQFIDDIRAKFKSMTMLILGMWLLDSEKFRNYYTDVLNQLKENNSLYYTVIDRDGNNAFLILNIWL